MKGKAIIPLVLGLGVGLLAVKMLVDTLKKAKASGTEQRMVTVVRAKQDIGEFQEITKDLVEQIEIADSKLIPVTERMATAEEVIGRVTGKSIPQQSPILKSMLAPEGTESGMSGRIEPGFRAVSVKIDEASAVAYQVKPGDWVDVIVVMDIQSNNRKSGGSKKQTIAEVILQKVQVGAIGQMTGGGASGAPDAKVKPAKSATLIVREEDVAKLHLAGTKGKITLAMRGADDSVATTPIIARESEVFSYNRDQEEEEEKPVVPTPPVATKTDLFANMFKPKAPEEPVGVTVYHGSNTGAFKVEQFLFENNHSRNLLNISDGPGSRAASLFGGATRSKTREPVAPPKPMSVDTPAPTTPDDTTPPPPPTPAGDESASDSENETINEG